MSPYELLTWPENRTILTSVENFDRAITSSGPIDDVNLDKTIDVFAPIRSSGLRNKKTIRQGDQLIVMNANTPYKTIENLIIALDKLFDKDNGWAIQTSTSKKSKYTMFSLLPSNMRTKILGVDSETMKKNNEYVSYYFHVQAAPSREAAQAARIELLNFCALVDYIVIDCDYLYSAAAKGSGGGSDFAAAAMLFEEFDNNDSSGGSSLAGRGKRPAKFRQPPVTQFVVDDYGKFFQTRDITNQYRKSQQQYADKIMKRLDTVEKQYTNFMDQSRKKCEKSVSNPLLPDLKGFMIEFRPEGLQDLYTRFDAPNAAKAQRKLNADALANSMESLTNMLNTIETAKHESERKEKEREMRTNIAESGRKRTNIVELQKNLAQFSVMLEASAETYRSFVTNVFETLDQIEMFTLFSLIAPMALLHFYKEPTMYLFNELPQSYDYLRRFLPAEYGYLHIDLTQYANYIAENSSYFFQSPALFAIYTMYVSLGESTQKPYLYIFTPMQITRVQNSTFYVGLLAIYLAHAINKWNKVQDEIRAKAMEHATVPPNLIPIVSSSVATAAAAEDTAAATAEAAAVAAKRKTQTERQIRYERRKKQKAEREEAERREAERQELETNREAVIQQTIEEEKRRLNAEELLNMAKEYKLPDDAPDGTPYDTPPSSPK